MADMVLFDPDKFADKATFASPHSPAEGIISVWINGTQVK
jgi:N-acyl-D-amino-acid deacylase